MFVLEFVSCGDGMIIVDSIIPNFVHILVNVIKIVIPILLIVLGLIDLGKATMAQKDDEIKKAQMTFVKRIVAAVLVFFVVAIVQLVFGLLNRAGGESAGLSDCVDCFINGQCSESTGSGTDTEQ